MNWKNRLTNYNFWISIFSAVLLILQAFKIDFDIAYVNEIFTAVLGLLVVIGIISDPTRTSVKSVDSTTSQENKTETIKAETKLEESIPTNEENEIDNDNLKDDIQTILTSISTNLEAKIKELEKFNLETFNRLNQKEVVQETEEKQEETAINQITEDVLPAVAEIDNPYIDVIN